VFQTISYGMATPGGLLNSDASYYQIILLGRQLYSCRTQSHIVASTCLGSHHRELMATMRRLCKDALAALTAAHSDSIQELGFFVAR